MRPGDGSVHSLTSANSTAARLPAAKAGPRRGQAATAGEVGSPPVAACRRVLTEVDPDPQARPRWSAGGEVTVVLAGLVDDDGRCPSYWPRAWGRRGSRRCSGDQRQVRCAPARAAQRDHERHMTLPVRRSRVIDDAVGPVPGARRSVREGTGTSRSRLGDSCGVVRPCTRCSARSRRPTRTGHWDSLPPGRFRSLAAADGSTHSTPASAPVVAIHIVGCIPRVAPRPPPSRAPTGLMP